MVQVQLAPLPNLRIGFISTRFAGTDGVSLEVRKWVEILESMGHDCYFFAGQCDYPMSKCYVVPEAFFLHPEIEKKHQKFFSQGFRDREDTVWVEEKKNFYRKCIDEFLEQYNIDLIVAQNAITIPMNIPLGLAITEIIAETGMPTIAHHHDFAWERSRFLVNGITDYLSAAFPPDLPTIQHVVINSISQRQLARQRGVPSTIIPNVMQYEVSPQPRDEYTADLRSRLGIKKKELFVLQPTRVIPRKGIEHAVELVRHLGRPACLVISHSAGDEGDEYALRIKEYAEALNVKLIFASDLVAFDRDTSDAGEKLYGLEDVYHEADLITFPSIFEGFGNAFLEGVYFRKPMVVNRYPVYAVDIAPKGFDVVEFDGFITQETVEKTLSLLDNPSMQKEMADKNYEIAMKYFSYSMARYKLRAILANAFGLETVAPTCVP